MDMCLSRLRHPAAGISLNIKQKSRVVGCDAPWVHSCLTPCLYRVQCQQLAKQRKREARSFFFFSNKTSSKKFDDNLRPPRKTSSAVSSLVTTGTASRARRTEENSPCSSNLCEPAPLHVPTSHRILRRHEKDPRTPHLCQFVTPRQTFS